MKYKNILTGIILLIVFFVPIYYTTGHCCGHTYDEGMTIIKHFILGQDSCLVLGNEFPTSILYIVVIITSLIMFSKGFSNKQEEVIKDEN